MLRDLQVAFETLMSLSIRIMYIFCYTLTNPSRGQIPETIQTRGGYMLIQLNDLNTAIMVVSLEK